MGGVGTGRRSPGGCLSSGFLYCSVHFLAARMGAAVLFSSYHDILKPPTLNKMYTFFSCYFDQMFGYSNDKIE